MNDKMLEYYKKVGIEPYLTLKEDLLKVINKLSSAKNAKKYNDLEKKIDEAERKGIEKGIEETYFYENYIGELCVKLEELAKDVQFHREELEINEIFDRLEFVQQLSIEERKFVEKVFCSVFKDYVKTSKRKRETPYWTPEYYYVTEVTEIKNFKKELKINKRAINVVQNCINYIKVLKKLGYNFDYINSKLMVGIVKGSMYCYEKTGEVHFDFKNLLKLSGENKDKINSCTECPIDIIEIILPNINKIDGLGLFYDLKSEELTFEGFAKLVFICTNLPKNIVERENNELLSTLSNYKAEDVSKALVGLDNILNKYNVYAYPYYIPIELLTKITSIDPLDSNGKFLNMVDEVIPKLKRSYSEDDLANFKVSDIDPELQNILNKYKIKPEESKSNLFKDDDEKSLTNNDILSEPTSGGLGSL